MNLEQFKFLNFLMLSPALFNISDADAPAVECFEFINVK